MLGEGGGGAGGIRMSCVERKSVSGGTSIRHSRAIALSLKIKIPFLNFYFCTKHYFAGQIYFSMKILKMEKALALFYCPV